MSHVHDLDNLEIEVTWRDEDDFRIDESEPLGGEWLINIDVGTSCCLEVPLAFIMELAGKAVASPQYGQSISLMNMEWKALFAAGKTHHRCWVNELLQ